VAIKKGGVCKTTTGGCLGETCWPAVGKRVLMLDMDPHGSLTRLGLAYDPAASTQPV